MRIGDTSGVREDAAQQVDACAGSCTHLDIQNLTIGIAHDLRGETGAIDLVQYDDLRDFAGADLVEHPIHGIGLLVLLHTGAVDDMQQQVGLRGLLEGGAKRIHEAMRKVADEADGIRDRHIGPVAEPEAARRRVQRGEKLVGDERVRARETVEEGRLSGIRVSHQGDAKHAGARASRALGPAAFREPSAGLTKTYSRPVAVKI